MPNCVVVPFPLFFELEPRLKEFYDVDKNTVISDISDSVDPSVFLKDPRKDDFRDEDRKTINISDYALATLEEFYLPISDEYNFDGFNDFIKKYGIEEESHQYFILWFMYALRKRNDLDNVFVSDEAEYDYLQYVLDVRPEMLKLYIALHSPNKNKKKKSESCAISFGAYRTVEVDTKTPWFQLALKRYLKKYLGVNSVTEAKRELLSVYGKKLGSPLNKDVVRYMWGTYHFLQTIPDMKSKSKGSVTNKQSRFITDYLGILGLIDTDEIESSNIRARLNYFLKNVNSLQELLDEQVYRLSPNNNPNNNIHGYF